MGRSSQNHKLSDEGLKARQVYLKKKYKSHAYTAAGLTAVTVGTAFLFVPLLIVTVPIQATEVVATVKIKSKVKKCDREMERRATEHQQSNEKTLSAGTESEELVESLKKSWVFAEPLPADINGNAPPSYETTMVCSAYVQTYNQEDENGVVVVGEDEDWREDCSTIEGKLNSKKKEKTISGNGIILEDDELEFLEL
ncbi:hypothetical protein SARC_11060 [Sphaeroforma arctica JP610]|uniref:Uncharacterized protein n=1 Tax=Sphaeroforma arctica JP610 TaxID=667725 RepID=A0A0L0FK74_9EUKA|nr:hypothetical protein SARC_11060 [Sphaeroforma arctica JP610]KNC76438.1 hypothetical protein SARC_11060 [Sphaeroforma arctica JP610]|eukprot:XP_014150340.1 hypothetical protein SARC_11060 [Sphaeroforma arctica JP610]